MIEMIVGAVIFAAGVGAGRLLPNRRRGKRVPVDPGPTCHCGHGVSFHGADGRCNAKVQVTKWVKGQWQGHVQEQCACQKYTGPEPLPSFYAPEISE